MGRQVADLALRHRRPHTEDRIRVAKGIGLSNLPLHELERNRIWLGSSRWPSSPRDGLGTRRPAHRDLEVTCVATVVSESKDIRIVRKKVDEYRDRWGHYVIMVGDRLVEPRMM
jgi:hypothetical protein